MKLYQRRKPTSYAGILLMVLLTATLCLAACDDSQVTENIQADNATATAIANLAKVKPDLKRVQVQLDEAWDNYKQRFIQNDGRVLDPLKNSLTTSEGQSYALLRAVWQNDQATFKRVLSWSQANLETRRGDKLFAYKWGKAPDNNYKILDSAVASDADTDIALALLFAAKLWGESDYQKLALSILQDLWDKVVVIVQNKPYLTAGDWAAVQVQPSLNPSYLAPYAYRIFANVDPAHKWFDLVETSYKVIEGCTNQTLGGMLSAKLPPNWCGLNAQNAQFTTAQTYPALDTNYGFDAFRLMWRVGLDYRWFGEKRALDYLTNNDTLRQKWKQQGRLATIYDHSGKVLDNSENLAMYVGALVNFQLTEPALADAIVATKILPAYAINPNDNPTQAFAGWGDQQNYYNQNWVWFGLAFYANRLPNLFTT